ncbi:MAG: hypothetical protein ABW007_26755 [Chitinophagaceae bacterium]
MFKRISPVILSALILLGIAVGGLFYFLPENSDQMYLEKNLRNWALFAAVGGVMTAAGAVAAAVIAYRISAKAVRSAEADAAQADARHQATLRNFSTVSAQQENSIRQLGTVGETMKKANQYRLIELKTQFESTIQEMSLTFNPLQGSLGTNDTPEHRLLAESMVRSLDRLYKSELANPNLYKNAQLLNEWNKLLPIIRKYIDASTGLYNRSYIEHEAMVMDLHSAQEIYTSIQWIAVNPDGKLKSPATDF